eukprot:3699239-Lingulodinium_polyedra.AAC.1
MPAAAIDQRRSSGSLSLCCVANLETLFWSHEGRPHPAPRQKASGGLKSTLRQAFALATEEGHDPRAFVLTEWLASAQCVAR